MSGLTYGKIMTPEEAAAWLIEHDHTLSIYERGRQAVERMLAAQGDDAEPELVQLQHDFTEAAMMRRKFLTQK